MFVNFYYGGGGGGGGGGYVIRRMRGMRWPVGSKCMQ